MLQTKYCDKREIIVLASKHDELITYEKAIAARKLLLELEPPYHE